MDAYLRYLTAEQRDPGYIQQTRREIAKAAKWCKDGSLDGLDFLDDPEADAKREERGQRTSRQADDAASGGGAEAAEAETAHRS